MSKFAYRGLPGTKSYYRAVEILEVNGWEECEVEEGDDDQMIPSD